MLQGPFLSRYWIGSLENYNDAGIVMLGLPFDGTCSYRPGSRFAPERLRLASWGLEDYSPIYDKHLEDVKFFDAGELEFPLGNTQKALDVKCILQILQTHSAFSSGKSTSVFSVICQLLTPYII